LNRIRNHFGTTRHPTAPVPEPATLFLAALAVFAVLIRRWRN